MKRESAAAAADVQLWLLLNDADLKFLQNYVCLRYNEAAIFFLLSFFVQFDKTKQGNIDHTSTAASRGCTDRKHVARPSRSDGEMESWSDGEME